MTQTEKTGDAHYPGHLIETDLIKLEWVLGYTVAREAYQKLIEKSHLTTPKARETILKKIKREGGFSSQCPYINTGNIPALHKAWQFQLVRVGGVWSDVSTYFGGADDLYAALANFHLYAAPADLMVSELPNGSWKVDISKIAVYVRDTYDFYDDAGGNQYLGHWNASGMEMAWGSRNMIMQKGFSGSSPDDFYFPVSNEAFRQWQTVHGTGGDYIIFSDAYIERVGGGLSFTATKEEINALSIK